MNENTFRALLSEKKEAIENIIYPFLPPEIGHDQIVKEAMNYSIRAGGKRLRPMLMQEVYKLFGGHDEALPVFMAAIEMIHTYSLVHDDLPAMDNDEYRRGKKTTHAVYGEGIGILAGDALLNYAFELLFESLSQITNHSFDQVMRLAKAGHILAVKSGVYGMIGGQTADLMTQSQTPQPPITKDYLSFIHQNKTAALIEASMMIGAVLAGATEEQICKMEECGQKIGLAFQIQDDILDVIGDSAILGKPVGSDERNGKATYVSLHGLESAHKDCMRLTQEALALLDACFAEHDFLTHLVKMLAGRNS
ncbi:MAG: polyprenyl synthetase family protein [Lachnospiraceae bacterium]|jgi:geranylgeranyl diphosphate synthase type II|nr:polyprenyl synthetase family protein [Lachnospiraceae bacterium]